MHNRQFVGCMQNLSIDGSSVDMAGFIANNGTRAGTWLDVGQQQSQPGLALWPCPLSAWESSWSLG